MKRTNGKTSRRTKDIITFVMMITSFIAIYTIGISLAEMIDSWSLCTHNHIPLILTFISLLWLSFVNHKASVNCK